MRINVKPDTTTSEILFFNEMDMDAFSDTRVIPLFGANGVGKTTFINAVIDFFKEEMLLHKLDEMEQDKVDKESPEYYGSNMHVIDSRRALWRRKHEDDAGFFNEEREKCRKRQCLTMDGADTGNIKLLKYNNSSNNFRNIEINPERGGDNFFNALALRWNAKELSEGQSIVYSTDGLFDMLLKSKEDIVEKDKTYLILLDEVDSGLSIDNIESVMRKMKRVTKKYDNIWFILSYNNPYVNNFYPKVFNMYNGAVETINSFDEFVGKIKEYKKQLDKARKNSKGQYKFFD